jgi:hypothetical protein
MEGKSGVQIGAGHVECIRQYIGEHSSDRADTATR